MGDIILSGACFTLGAIAGIFLVALGTAAKDRDVEGR